MAAPDITNFSPVDGSPIAATDPITFDIVYNGDQLGLITIWVKFANGIEEVVVAEMPTAFTTTFTILHKRYQFATTSAVDNAGTTSLSLTRDGGWHGVVNVYVSVDYLNIVAVDNVVGVVSYTADALPVMADFGATFSPVGPGPLASLDPLTITLDNLQQNAYLSIRLRDTTTGIVYEAVPPQNMLNGLSPIEYAPRFTAGSSATIVTGIGSVSTIILVPDAATAMPGADWYNTLEVIVAYGPADPGGGAGGYTNFRTLAPPIPNDFLDNITIGDTYTCPTFSGGGGSGVLSIVSPALGSPIDQFTEIVVDCTADLPLAAFYDPDPPLQLSGAYEVIYDGAAFTPFYGISRKETIFGGFRYFIRRVGGWRETPAIGLIPDA